MSAFVFQSKGHRYTLDGVRLPSVTEIIREAGLSPSMDFVTDWHLDRGSQTHAATALWDQDDLDESVLDATLRGRVEAWKAFRAESGNRLQILEIEQPAYSATYRFAGTADRVVMWDGRRAILELKSGGKQKHHAVQVGGYQDLYDAPLGFVVYLTDSGRYTMIPVERDARAAFLGCLSFVRIREKYGDGHYEAAV